MELVDEYGSTLTVDVIHEDGASTQRSSAPTLRRDGGRRGPGRRSVKHSERHLQTSDGAGPDSIEKK